MCACNAGVCCAPNVCKVVHVHWCVQMHVRPSWDIRGFEKEVMG